MRCRLLYALAAWTVQVARAFTCLPANNAADCEALGDLYTTGGGPSWTGLGATDGWAVAARGGAPDVCAPGSFTGVTCDLSGRVASMCVQEAWQPFPCGCRARSLFFVPRARANGPSQALLGC